MGKSKSFFPILIPSATVFFSSGCIMVLELVAGRLIAKDLGSSLYTWTSVIGVVLAGITIGNYVGGRIADRFPARKALSVLFGISSVTCVGTVALNNVVGDWMFLWYVSWPLRIFSHVLIVFVIPSTLLGTISPVVAKMALDEGLPTGRTVGDIYAWGAAGSIVGTFLAGFYLIPTIGTIAIVWSIAAALLLMAMLYWARFWALYVWAAIFVALMTIGMAPVKWAEIAGASLALREEPDPSILYEDETEYNYIAVAQLSTSPDKREFMQDRLTHSLIIMDDIRDLQYAYAQIYAAVTNRSKGDKDKLSVLVIGGGGYVYPRYVERVWAGSHVDVVEIDPGVTEAAIQAFGLSRDTTVNTFTMDARNYVDDLLKRMRSGEIVTRYDFIYEDAINHYSVPFQLVTKEFNDKIAQILTDDGVYMINLIDVYDSGLFLGSIVNTLQQTFSHVYVVTGQQERSDRNTFVVVAAEREIDLEDLDEEESLKSIVPWVLSDSDIRTLENKALGIVLTDNYVPVENLLAPVARQDTVNFVLEKGQELAEGLQDQGKLEESIAVYRELVKVKPRIPFYWKIATMRVEQGRLYEAAEACRQAIDYSERSKGDINVARIHLRLALLLKELRQTEELREHFSKAVEGFRRALTRNPESVENLFNLSEALTQLGQFAEASTYLQRAVDLDPFDVKNHSALAQTLLRQERDKEAIEQLRKGIRFMLDCGQQDDAAELQRLLDSLELEESKQE